MGDLLDKETAPKGVDPAKNQPTTESVFSVSSWLLFTAGLSLLGSNNSILGCILLLCFAILVIYKPAIPDGPMQLWIKDNAAKILESIKKKAGIDKKE